MIKFDKKNGFTLIELLVTIAIIAILTAITIIGLTSTRQKAQDTSHLAGLRDLQISLEAYKSVNAKYATSFTDLVPSYMAKAPDSEYTYKVSSDFKTYCVYLKNVINKPESQTDIYYPSCAKSWVACKGSDITALNTDCPDTNSNN